MSIDEGRASVSLARAALDARYGISGRPSEPAIPIFSEKRGVFVTLNKAGTAEEKLRGCIGFPYPVKPLGEAIREAAVAAATEDPRFPPVKAKELDSITVEVSVLTVPQPLSVQPRDRPSAIRIGVDGLIISDAYNSGLLLPQVATEFSLNQEGFLLQACLKAGLAPGAWLDRRTEVQVFQAEIFAEESPRGKVHRVDTRDL